MSKYLLGYKINGKIVVTDLSTWSVELLNGNNAMVVVNDIKDRPANYADISSIINWDYFGLSLLSDYLSLKTVIKEIITSIGWSGLTSVEKDIAIKYYSYDSDYDAVVHLMTTKGYTQEQAQVYLLQQWHRHHGNLINSCKERWYYVKLVVPAFLSFSDCEDLLNIVEMLVFSYNDIGRMGINYGDNKDGLMDYIESTGIFTNNGLREKNYTLLYGNIDMFIFAMKDVLINGEYTKYTDFDLK